MNGFWVCDCVVGRKEGEEKQFWLCYPSFFDDDDGGDGRGRWLGKNAWYCFRYGPSFAVMVTIRRYGGDGCDGVDR